MSAVLKEEGNALLAAKDFSGAEAKYTAALALSPSVAALFSNRALARHLQGNFVGALDDAEQCVKLDKKWLKGHFHRVRALLALGSERAAEAQRCFWEGLQHGGKENPDFVALEKAVSEAYIAAFYSKMTKDLSNVEVRYIDNIRGKGLFATKSIRMFKPIFSEVPLVSHRKLFEHGAPDACSFCLRSFAVRADVEKTKFGPMFDKVYPEQPKWLFCVHCEIRAGEMGGNDVKEMICWSYKENSKVMDASKVKDPFLRGNPFFLEKYCSELCREGAWHSYHACLCGASFVSDEKRVHPLHHLYNLCVESGRSNPLMIARIFAIVFQRVAMDGRKPEEAFQDFQNFVSVEEESPIDDMAVFLLKNIFSHFPFMNDIVTLANYRRLNSAILRNAQTVTPVSDVHMWFERALEDEKRFPNLMESLDFTPEQLKHYMAKPEMTSLSKVEGFALLPVANCMNHSCDPNVISSSSHNNHSATFVALRPIEAGEELVISYVNDNLPFDERHALLNQFYKFECKCIRCYVQKEKVPIIE